MSGSAAIGSGFDDGVDRCIGRVVIGEPIDQVDERVRLEEDQSPGVEVIGERTKRLGSEPVFALRTQRCAGSKVAVVLNERNALVDAAHAVDRDLFDEEFFFDKLCFKLCFAVGRLCFRSGLRIHC